MCLTVLEERRQELKQLENIEEKAVKEVASAKEKLSHLQAEIEKLGRVDDLRVQTKIKCKVCIYSSPLLCYKCIHSTRVKLISTCSTMLIMVNIVDHTTF